MRNTGWMILVLVAVTAAGWAATTRPAASSGGKAVGLLSERVADLERQIAQRNMKRIDLAGDALARHEACTDLLVIAHALASQGVLSKPASDAQILTWLRARELAAAAGAVEDALSKQAEGTMTASQKDALKSLHQATFRIDPKTTADVDALCAAAGALVLRIGLPEAPDARTLPAMRPTIKVAAPATKEVAALPPIAQLLGSIQTAAIAPRLRGQLLALARLAADPAEEDSAVLYRTLAELTAFTKSLENHIAVAPERRQEIQNQLAESLALYNDSRTRGVARKRLDALAAFGQSLARIDRLALTGQQKGEIAPALAWANESDETGAVLAGFLERFINVLAEIESVRKSSAAPAILKKPSDDLTRQFEQHRKDFWAATVDLPKRTESGLDALRLNLEEMERLKELAETFTKLPGALETLTAYRPRPGGGLEKRLQSLATAATAAGSGRGDPKGAGKQLDAIVALARVATGLGTLPLKDIPAEIAIEYAGDALGGIEAKWRTAVTDAASAAAGGVEIDRGRVLRLERLHRCLAALADAAATERAIVSLQTVHGWVDWAADGESARKLLEPYRLASSMAISAFGTDNGDGLDGWVKSRDRYAPLMALYRRAATAAAACDKLPTGVAGVAAQLRTAIDQQPFAPERYASFVISQWTLWSEEHSAEADALIEPMCRRLAKEMKGDDAGPKQP